MQIDIDGKSYFIHRKGKKQKGTQVSVTVDFYTYDQNNIKVILNGLQRSDTNKEICKYIGTYYTFQNTLGIFQKTTTGLVFQKQSERKNFLSTLLNIQLYQKLYSISSDEIKQTKLLLKQYQQQFPEQQIQLNKKLISKIQSTQQQKQNTLDNTQQQLKKLQQSKIHTQYKLKDVIQINESIQQLTQSKNTCQLGIQRIKTQLLNLNIDDKYKQIQQIEKQLQLINIDNINNKNTQLTQLVNKAKDIKKQIQINQNNIKNCNSKLDKLGNLEYDPKCTYCMNNIFVKDAIQSKQLLQTLNNKKQELLTSVNTIIVQIKQLQYVKSQLEQYNNKSTTKTTLYQRARDLEKKKELLNNQQTQIQKKLQIINKNIQLYYLNKDTIQNNKIINQKLNSINNQIKLLQNDTKLLQQQINTDLVNIKVYERKNIQLNNIIEKIKQLQERYNLYNKYIQSVHKNGIPLKLIQQVIPLIQTQTNNILSMLSEFTLQMQINQSNIDIYRVYNIDNKLPVQLGSGFEQTVSDIATRIALSKISNTPRSNVVIIDENFSALDNNNIMKVQYVFQYLSQYYQYVMVISHIDILKSMVDNSILITKQNQYSKIIT